MFDLAIVDGDDTLWTDNRRFAQAAVEVCTNLTVSISCHTHLFMTELESIELRRVGIGPYGPVEFLSSLRLLLHTKFSLCSRDVTALLDSADLCLQTPPILYSDSLAFLSLIKSNASRVVLYTKGHVPEQERKINRLDMGREFDDVWITSSKSDVDLRRRIGRKSTTGVLLVGDSVSNDIVPAVQLGLSAILVGRGDGWIPERRLVRHLQNLIASNVTFSPGLSSMSPAHFERIHLGRVHDV